MIFPNSGPGNEDTHDAAGNDHDTSQFGPGSQITTQKFSGALAGLVTGGDLPITFLVNNAANGATVRDENGTPVTSIGLEVHYAAVDSQNIEGRTSDNRLIFTLHVNTDGTFTFTLNDQIDHPTHTHDNGQGFGEETLNLDISNAIIAHDATPDPIVFPTNTIEIGVIDDTPIAFDSAPFYPQPDVEGSGSFSSALDDEDQSHGIQNGPGDNGFGTSVSGILEILPGADNYGSVSFAAGVSVTATDGVNTTSISQLQAIWVDGSGFGHKEDVTLTWVADGSGGGTLTGSTSHLANAFTLTVDKFGDYTFSANAPLAHPFTADPGNPGSSEFEDNLSLVFTYTATDGDGDQVDAHLTINVDDDVPSLFSVTVNEFDVTVDETPGVQTAVDPFPANDVLDTGLSTAIKNLFDAIGSARGVDGDVAPGTLDDGALSFAASTGSLLSIGAVNFGADGPFGGSAATGTTLSLKVTDGTYSGVQTTDGHDVFLYAGKGALSGLILGRVGTEASPTPGLDTKDPNGTVAFALTTDASGKVYIADYLPLLNPTAGSTPAAYNDQIQLASGTVQAVVTLKDGDGDTVSSSGTDISSHIRFQDDGPSVLGVNDGTGPNLVNNGSFEQGHIDLAGTDWSIYSSLPNPPGNPWTYGADHIPFEVQIGEPGGLAAQDGIALVELDGDTTGNGHAGQATPDPVHTDATIQQVIAGTVAGQEYELTFYYSPRPGDSANNDSGLRVLWNGVEIDNIDSTNLPSGWTQITLHVIGTGNDTLAFQGTGPEDEFGAFIDNVSLHAVTILDDEDTTLNPAIEVQGGPGDDGHGVVAAGQILFNAGADGLKSIVVNGIGGLQAVFVDANGVGHPESVTQYSWTPDALRWRHAEGL